ncbi:hypothetical protein HK405_005349 [Cladochytrium tenue]|nr:hypothetical protein HK405_005349 [Cladochytrium tenue]
MASPAPRDGSAPAAADGGAPPTPKLRLSVSGSIKRLAAGAAQDSSPRPASDSGAGGGSESPKRPRISLKVPARVFAPPPLAVANDDAATGPALDRDDSGGGTLPRRGAGSVPDADVAASELREPAPETAGQTDAAGADGHGSLRPATTTGAGRLARTGNKVGTILRKSLFLDAANVLENKLVDWFTPKLRLMLHAWIRQHLSASIVNQDGGRHTDQ